MLPSGAFYQRCREAVNPQRGTFRKTGLGWVASFPKPLPCLVPRGLSLAAKVVGAQGKKGRGKEALTQFLTKICDFPNLIYDQRKNLIPYLQESLAIYDCCGWHSCSKLNLWRSFVDGITSNDETVASENMLNSRPECKNHTLMTKTAEKPYPLGKHKPL